MEIVTHQDAKPWIRKLEPRSRLELPNEYNNLAQANFRESDLSFANELARKIPSRFSSQVIDLGCGPGQGSVFLAGLRPDISLICFDYSQEMLDLAKERARQAGIPQGQIRYQQGDFTTLRFHLPEVTDAFVYSNTAIHELRNKRQLFETFEGIAQLIGDNGGALIRDLALPNNAIQAEQWRKEVLGAALIPPRELELFENSQHAAFRLEVVQNAIDRTSLKERGVLIKMQAPKSRYWLYSLGPMQQAA